VPKEYFGYDQENKTHAYHKQVMADRYPGYSFLKALLDLAYCRAHVPRDFKKPVMSQAKSPDPLHEPADHTFASPI